MKPEILTPDKVARWIPDGAHIAASGFATAGLAQAVHEGIITHFLNAGSPKNLHYYHAARSAKDAKVLSLMCVSLPTWRDEDALWSRVALS
jgi:acyl CoA:acetate/3-ketoacid CoA transferase